MSLYDLNPELDSPQVYGDPASDPVGTVRAYLGPHPQMMLPAVRIYRKNARNDWTMDASATHRDDDWVKDCAVIYRPVPRGQHATILRQKPELAHILRTEPARLQTQQDPVRIANRLQDSIIDDAIDWARKFDSLYWAVQRHNRDTMIADVLAFHADDYDRVPHAIDHLDSLRIGD